MGILIKFTDNDREYQVRYDGNIRYGYINKEKQFIDLEDTNELDFVKEIFMRVLPSKKIINIGKVRYKDKEYQMYFDIDNGYRLFSPSDREVRELYLLYNYDRDILYRDSNDMDKYNDRDRDKGNGYVKRMVNVKKRIIAVSVSILVLMYGSLLVFDSDYGRDTKTEIAISMSVNLSDEEILDRVQKALDKNDKLDNQEREFILDSIRVIIDDKKYFDWEYIYKVLEDIDIEYVKRYNQDMDLGSYNPGKKKIICYGVSSFDEANKGTLRHEVRHAITKFKDNYNSFLVEVFTTIYNKDYYGEDSGYNQIIHYGRALLEIIGEEPVKKYLGYTDTNNIKKELMKIIDDEDMAIRFLSELDIYKDKILEGKYYYEYNMEFMHSLEDDIYEGFRKYYEAKYGRSMDNDLIMQYYLDRRIFDALIASNYYLPRDNESGEVMVVQEKNYFNDKDDNALIVDYYVFEYREERVGNNIVTRYVRDRYRGDIVIDENNRYIDKKGYGLI